MERLDKQLAFLMEMDKLKKITRQTYLADGSRKENDAEHSFHLALMCAVLSEYANEEIDVLKTMMMVLVHDAVEIDAGDTYAYDEQGNGTKKAREIKAADRLFGILPKEQEQYFRDLWEEFEEERTKEACFAAALDKIQPLLLNGENKGKSWIEHQVSEEQVLKRNENTKRGSQELWEYCLHIIEEHVRKGVLIGGKESGTAGDN